MSKLILEIDNLETESIETIVSTLTTLVTEAWNQARADIAAGNPDAPAIVLGVDRSGTVEKMEVSDEEAKQVHAELRQQKRRPGDTCMCVNCQARRARFSESAKAQDIARFN